MPKENKFAFPDTMIFLHFQFFTEIDWNEVLQTQSSSLVVPPIITRELEKHKLFHSSETIRERAKKATKKIVELITSKSPVRAKVNIQFERVEPQIEFEKYNLSKDVSDDYLIASILRFQVETENKAVLITDDSGLKLKAISLNIEVVELPERYRTKPEKSSDKKEVEKLRNELISLKNKTPKLKLLSLTSEKNISCQILPNEKFSIETLNSELDEVVNKYHLIVETTKPKTTVTLKLKEGGIFGNYQSNIVEFKLHSGETRQSHQGNVDDYNKKLEKFHGEYANYLRVKYRVNNLRSRTVTFQVKLENEGTVPATGVNVILYFPPNFRITTKEKIFSFPNEVKPPIFIDTSDIFNRHLSAFDYLSTVKMPPLPQIASPAWEKVSIERRDEVYTASFQRIKLNHGYSFNCPEKIYVMFPNDSMIKPFQIDYKITADNLPEAIVGKLNVKIAK